ncbi:hypothetical protein B9N43_04765 [Denitratisoma sp. DHT3]|uniref:hypothetical protein n=1 Tax=Denitratisoma sp. DHT3 TaxID=1981880 RepID=UPI0011983612|nr:hypothetical protein [Denitratisoma sp. DHT3]QDX80617.1 hypothetical protein B9N43_04765 [Denitratisoma sp. DHT3]
MSHGVLDDIEKCMESGWTDGLPVIPPYGSLVDPMLEALGWQAGDVVGEIPDQSIKVRAEQVAATAVMAGCKTEYAPVLRALALAILDPRFNVSGVEVTTGGASVLVIVSGPVVAALGFEHEANALGANSRINATVGRFAQMMRLFCGKGGGVLQSHGTVGHPGRLSFCIAEHPETAWGPYHTQFGLPAEVSAVSIMASEGPNSCNNHYARSGAAILDTIGDCMLHYGQTAWYYRSSGYLVVIAPDHMALVKPEFTREQARQYLYENARRQTDDLVKVGRIAIPPLEYAEVEFGAMRTPLKTIDQLTFIECGAAGGRFSAVIPRWAGSQNVVCKQIEGI